MEYIIHLSVLILIYSCLAVSLNLLVGYTGILSLAHAGFYGIGAYATAISMKSLGFSFLSSIGVSVFIVLVISLFVGYALSRTSGGYYALGSLGFSMIVYSILLNWNSLTNGPMGIFAIPRPDFGALTLSSNLSFLFFTLIICLIIVGLTFAITRSHFGRVLRAIRDDEEALVPFGYKTSYFKLVVFCISAIFASVCGSLYATYVSFIDPTSFSLHESIYILTIVILGGLASIRGSIAGAIILTLLPEALRFVGLPLELAAQLRVIIYGLVIVYITYHRPFGLFGKYAL